MISEIRVEVVFGSGEAESRAGANAIISDMIGKADFVTILHLLDVTIAPSKT